MNLQVLVSTMYQSDSYLYKKMNIKTDSVIVNQYEGKEKIVTEKFNNCILKMVYTNDRGLSKSRNMAIAHATADICILADDDLVYNDEYPQLVRSAYEKYKNADIIAFHVRSTNSSRPTSIISKSKVGFLSSMKISSFQITFRRKSIVSKKLQFNSSFGAGARYVCGEENIFLTECLRAGLEIRYVDSEIATVNHNESTWFKGFDHEYLKTKGAMFYEMKPQLSLFLIGQYALRKGRLYKETMNSRQALKYMIEGLVEHRKIKSLS